MVNFSPDAVGEVLLLLPELAAAWLLVVLELLGGVEEVLPPPPHAASPTTAAAARTEAANHRLRIVSTPFATVTRSAYTRSTYVAPESFMPRFRSASGGYPLAKPRQRERVPVFDAAVARVEQLEPDHLVGDADLAQRRAECVRAQVQVVLVPGARVDPDRPQRPERPGVPGHHPDRVPVQPPRPCVIANGAGARVERQLHRPVLVRREARRHPEHLEQDHVGLLREGDPGPELLPPPPDVGVVVPQQPDRL